MADELHIRWMIRHDMPQVQNIEDDSFEWPWSEEEFIRCLRQRNSIGMVATYGDTVAGFMVYELNKSHLDVLDFAVAAEYRRRGVGSAMVQSWSASYRINGERKSALAAASAI